MIDNYEQDASRLLNKLSVEDRAAPVKIYKLAEKMGLMVLIQATEEDKQKMMKSTIIEKTMMDYIFDKKIPWGVAQFYLLLEDENPINRRMKTACAIAHIVDKPSLAVWPVRSHASMDNKIYCLALCILMPLDDVMEFLKKYNYSISDALQSNWMIETLSTEFFVYKIDVINRLKMLGGLVDAEESRA